MVKKTEIGGSPPTAEELLNYLNNSGMLDLSSIQDEIAMKTRQQFLAMHQYSIWLGKDGKFRTYIPDEEGGRKLKKRNTRKEIEDLIVDYWKQQADNPTVEDVFEEWNDRRLELNKISKATHLRNQQFFNRHYDQMGQRKIKWISPDEWIDFLEEQIPRFDLTAKGFSGLKGITRGILKWAKKRKLINFRIEDVFSELDVTDVDFKKVIHEDYEEVFSEDETPVMMKYLSENCDMLNSIILLIFVSGIRSGEAVALKHCDIHENSIDIRRTETRYSEEEGSYIYDVKDFPKTGAGVRTVVIPDSYIWLLRQIQSYNPNGEYIFVRDNQRIHTRGVRHRLQRVCNKLGIYPKSLHKIRKTYATILLDNNVDQELVKDQMGHTDISCTEDHYHRNRKSLDRKSSIISSLPDFKPVEEVDYQGNQR